MTIVRRDKTHLLRSGHVVMLPSTNHRTEYFDVPGLVTGNVNVNI